MNAMKSLGTRMPTLDAKAIFASARRWVCLSIGGLCLMVGAAHSEAGNVPTVSQEFWLDRTQQMTFEEVRSTAFSPLYPGIRQKFSQGIGWARLSLESTTALDAPLMLHIRPALFSRVTVFTPPEKDGGPWLSRDITSDQLKDPFALGISKTGATVYVRLEMPWDWRLMMTVGSASALNDQVRQLDAIVTFHVTLLLTIFVTMMMQSGAGLRWLRYSMYFFAFCFSVTILLFVGYGQTLTGLDLTQSNLLIKCFFILTLFSVGLVWAFFAKEIYPKSTWVNWIFLWPAAVFLTLPIAWIDIELAVQFSERLQTPGAFAYGLILLMQAIRSPDELKNKSTKNAFFILLILAVVTGLKSTTAYFGWDILPKSTVNLSLSTELLIRGLIPTLLTISIYLMLVSARLQRMKQLQTSLLQTQSSLGMERQRLDRQLKFNVMLSHELKNPLMASHMALSNLQRQLEPVGPSRQSAETIRDSLETIDSIIDRCAEVDEYESANAPLTLSQFSVESLLTSLKSMHKDERIYIVTRHVDDDLLLTSDIHYLKVILNNLLSNALKYSQPDTLIELLLVQEKQGHGQTLEFSVSNTLGAAGAPDPDKVFGRFYRSEGARQQPGTGQGLWLAQSMAQALGSRIILKTDGLPVTFGFSILT
jgi:signal transduction histidine kinase